MDSIREIWRQAALADTLHTIYMSRAIQIKDTARSRRQMRRIWSRFHQHLRGIFRQRAPGHYARFPENPRPCHTCAFNPGTDGERGYDATAMNLMDALLAGRPFFCHQPLPRDPVKGWLMPWDQIDLKSNDLSPFTQPCAGWWVVHDDPEARRAFVRAARPATQLSAAKLDDLADALTLLRE